MLTFLSVFDRAHAMYRAHGISIVPRQPRPAPYIKPSTRGLETRVRINICRFLLLGWTREQIAEREGCSLSAVRNVEMNLRDHGSVRRPQEPAGKLGDPLKLVKRMLKLYLKS